MNWVAAAGTGFGLGLAYFGGLWVSVRGLERRRSLRGLARARLLRLALAGVTFYALLKAGGLGAVAAGLVGLVGARWHLARTLGGAPDGR